MKDTNAQSTEKNVYLPSGKQLVHAIGKNWENTNDTFGRTACGKPFDVNEPDASYRASRTANHVTCRACLRVSNH